MPISSAQFKNTTPRWRRNKSPETWAHDFPHFGDQLIGTSLWLLIGSTVSTRHRQMTWIFYFVGIMRSTVFTQEISTIHSKSEGLNLAKTNPCTRQMLQTLQTAKDIQSEPRRNQRGGLSLGGFALPSRPIILVFRSFTKCNALLVGTLNWVLCGTIVTQALGQIPLDAYCQLLSHNKKCHNVFAA